MHTQRSNNLLPHTVLRSDSDAVDNPSGEESRRRPVRVRRRWLILLAALGVVSTVIAFPFLWQDRVETRYAASIYMPDAAPKQQVAIVLGARVYPSGRLSGMLRDRVDTAVELYKRGTVQKLLLTGDNSRVDYNEPDAMAAYAMAQGVPAADIQPDYGGRRTYDSCYRARDIFQVKSAVLVSQAFHLPRAPLSLRPTRPAGRGCSSRSQPLRSPFDCLVGNPRGAGPAWRPLRRHSQGTTPNPWHTDPHPLNQISCLLRVRIPTI